MGVGEILSEIAKGLTAFVPAFGKAIVNMFSYLFLNFTETEAGVVTFSGFSTLGGFLIAGVAISFVFFFGRMALGLFRNLKARRVSK